MVQSLPQPSTLASQAKRQLSFYVNRLPLGLGASLTNCRMKSRKSTRLVPLRCLSSIILSPLNGNVKMSPYEQGNICIEPERATTSGGYFQMREGGVGVCQSRRTPVPERAPN